MRNYAELNRPGIYRRLRAKEVLAKRYNSLPYKWRGVLLRASKDRPIYSYGKNFTKFKKEFSLFIWTQEGDQEKIEAHFDKVVKGLKREQIMEIILHIKGFSYLTPEYEAK